MFTDSEIRQAVVALSIIGERGNQDEFDYLLHEVRSKHPASGTGGMTPGARLQAAALADKAARLLGEPVKRCEAAAVDVMGAGQQRAVFDAIVGYAAELAQQRQQGEREPDLLSSTTATGWGPCSITLACAASMIHQQPSRHGGRRRKPPRIKCGSCGKGTQRERRIG